MYLYLCISTILNAITSLVIGIAVSTRPKQNSISRIFAFQCFLIFLWSVLYIYPFFPDNKLINLFSFQYLHLASNFITVAHFALVIHVLRIYKQQKYLLWFGIFLHTLFLFFIPTTLFIEDVIPKFNFYFWPKPGIIYHIWIISWSFFMLYPTWLLFKHYKKSIGLRKQQIKGFLIGTIIGLLSGSTNYFLFYNINIPPFLNPLASLYVCSTAYLIARYRFFNIKLNFLRFAHKTVSFVLALIFLYLIYFYINYFFPIPQTITTNVVFLLIALIFYHFFETTINMKYFSRIFQLSDNERFCSKLNLFIKEHHFDVDFPTLQARIYKTFVQKLRLEEAKLILIDSSTKKKYPKTIYHFKKTKSKNPFIFSELELQQADENKTSYFLEEISLIGEMVLPIYNSKKKLIAFFVLGKKQFSNPFYTEEINLLKDISYYLSLSLSVINYHKTLSKEVTKKTKALRQKNEQLEESYKQLQHLDNVKDEFLSIASHELRTPLSIIKGYTDFLRLKDFGPLTNKQSEFVEKIFKNTNDLISLINRMLDISRLESGKMDFYPSEINMVQFIKNIQQEFKVIYADKNLKLLYSNPEKVKPIVFLDPEKLSIVFTNLLGNAYKFTPENKKVWIILELIKKEKKIKITIKDQGIGIPKDKFKFIFNKFQQAENPLQKTYSGSGLGLNITKQIVEKFGGKIWVESEEKIKKGSAFIFTLPYTEKKQEA